MDIASHDLSLRLKQHYKCIGLDLDKQKALKLELVPLSNRR
jgi:hypothetical protein